MHPTPVTGKRVADLFFTRDTTDSNLFVRRCGTPRKRSGSSYQNLLSHVQTAHPNYVEVLLSGRDLTQRQMEIFFATNKSKNLVGWMDFVDNGLLPFHFVEKKEIRKHVKHDPQILINS